MGLWGTLIQVFSEFGNYTCLVQVTSFFGEGPHNWGHLEGAVLLLI